MNTINIQLTKLTTDNYTNTMYLKKDERSEVEKKRRHDKEHLDLNKELIDKKRKELEQRQRKQNCSYKVNKNNKVLC